MNKFKHQQLMSIEELPDNLDYIICATGYESRCTYAFGQLASKKQFSKKICVGFNDNKVLAREKSDLYFRENKFEEHIIDSSSAHEIFNLLKGVIDISNLTNEVNIAIDYSSMTKVWYAGVLNYFKTLELNGKVINLFFIYSFSEFTPPATSGPYNAYVDPIEGFSNLTIPERPTALIIGLGYEKKRAFSLKEYLDAEVIYLFIADNSFSQEYYDAVIKENKVLIQHTPSENIFYYPLNDITYAEMILTNLCESLLNNYRIVLAPCGPKPFTLINFVVSLNNNDIDVWRVSAGSLNPPVDKKANNGILVSKIEIINPINSMST